MTSEGLGEMFEGDSADTCTGKFSLTSMGAERRVSRAQTRERGSHRRERKLSMKNHKKTKCVLQQKQFIWPLQPSVRGFIDKTR